MGQSQSHTATTAQPANRSTTTMGKRITAPATTTDTQPTPTTTLPTLTPSAIRTQLKHLTALLTPSLVDSIKRRDEAAIGQFEALHSQLSALYNNPSLPDEYEVRVHELWRRAETLRTAVNVVEGLRERGRVEVSEMEGEDERDKKREQARTRVEEVEREDRQQWKKAVELQKLAARRAAEQRQARSKQSKLTGRISKARKSSTTKPQQKKRKVVSEDEEEEDVAEEDEEMDGQQHTAEESNGPVNSVAEVEADDSEEEEEVQPPVPKKATPTARTSRVTRATKAQHKDGQSNTRPPAALPTTKQPPTHLASTPLPNTYTRRSTAAATVVPSVQSNLPTRKSPRKQLPLPSLRSAVQPTRSATAADSSTTPTAAVDTPNKRNSVTGGRTADRGVERKEERVEAAKSTSAAVSRLNPSRATAAMTPERRKAEVVEVAGPGVGRTGKRRRTAMVVRQVEHDIYDTFDV